MTFGHTSQGTKPCCPAYFMFCVMQKAADRVGWVGAFLSGRLDACVITGIWRVTDRLNLEVTQDVARVGNEV